MDNGQWAILNSKLEFHVDFFFCTKGHDGIRFHISRHCLLNFQQNLKCSCLSQTDWGVLTPLVRPQMSSSSRTQNKLSSLMFDSLGQRVDTRALSLSLAGPSKVSGQRVPAVWSGTLCGWPCCDKVAVHNYNRLSEEFLPLRSHWGLKGESCCCCCCHHTTRTTSHLSALCLFIQVFFNLLPWCLLLSLCKSMYFYVSH